MASDCLTPVGLRVLRAIQAGSTTPAALGCVMGWGRQAQGAGRVAAGYVAQHLRDLVRDEVVYTDRKGCTWTEWRLTSRGRKALEEGC